jgi:hypothetical protein
MMWETGLVLLAGNGEEKKDYIIRNVHITIFLE